MVENKVRLIKSSIVRNIIFLGVLSIVTSLSLSLSLSPSRKKGRTGYCPATIIRRAIEISQQQRSPSTSAESLIYESEKSIYEGLNIHKPPPRK